MSLTPIPAERCGHVAPMAVEAAEGGYAARCLRCGTTGPVRASSGFSATLRDETGLAALNDDLVSVVRETMRRPCGPLAAP